MKKFLVGVVCFLMLLTGVAFAESTSFLHDISVDNQKTAAVLVPKNASVIGVFIPDVPSNATVGVEFYDSGTIKYSDLPSAVLLASSDTSWHPIIDALDGADAVILASAADPGFVDITLFIAPLENVYIRFTLSATQASDTTWYLHYKY